MLNFVLSAVLGLSGFGVAAPPVVRHFDLPAGQMPENVVLDRDHSVDVTFAGARQVARISSRGRTEVLATLPAPADPAARTPLLGFPLTTGLVRVGHTFYVLYATGSATETGVWTFTEGRAPHKLADLPADGLPNGMALANGTLYVTDSAKGAVYAVTTTTGRVAVFAAGPALAPNGFFGANGAKVRGGNLYVSNLDRGTVLRAPLTGPRAGVFTVFDSGLTGIDDFAFTGRGDQYVAGLVTQNTVVLADGHGTHRTVLTTADGLSNPTSVAIRGTTVYIASAAYTTQTDPNLLITHLPTH
jgi:hypothetical protein